MEHLSIKNTFFTLCRKPEVQNSPLKEPNRIVEDEESIDSPIKKTTKVKTSGARRRIESSSEEENGSPVKESPPKVKVKAAASKGKKRKSSPSSSEKTKSTKKAKEEDEEKLELESELEGLKEEAADLEIPTQSRSNKRRSQQEKDALPKKSKSATKNEAKNDETIEAEEKAKTTEGKAKRKSAAKKKSPPKKEKTPEKPIEKSSPKKEKSPEKSSPKKEKSPEKSSPKKEKSAEKTPKAKLNPFAAMMGKSPASSSSDSSSTKPYEEVIKKDKYKPIEDAIWKKDAKTPYLAFAKTLQAIEATSGRLKTIEILSNYFKSVMALSPDDLLPSVYMCLNRIAPAYEGKELGIGETLLMKAIAQTTGRSVAQIKADVGKKGQLVYSRIFLFDFHWYPLLFH